MSKFDDFISVLREKTGWKEPKINEENRHYFTIQGKNNEYIDLEFFSPEGNTLIMLVKLIALPVDIYEKNELLKDYAKKEVAACKIRPSILSIDNNNLILYINAKLQDNELLLNQVNTFLKDVDWWLQKPNDTFASPFSFSATWNR